MEQFHYSRDTFPCLLGGVCVAIATERPGDVRFSVKHNCPPTSLVWEDGELHVFWGFDKPVPVHNETHAVRIQSTLLDTTLGLTKAFRPLKAERWFIPVPGLQIPEPTSPVLHTEELHPTLSLLVQGLELGRYKSEFDVARHKDLVMGAVGSTPYALHNNGVVYLEGDVAFKAWEDMLDPDTLAALDVGYLQHLAQDTVFETTTELFWHKVHDSWIRVPKDELAAHIQMEHVARVAFHHVVAAVLAYVRMENAVYRVEKYPFQDPGTFQLDGKRYLNLLTEEVPSVMPVLIGKVPTRQDLAKTCPVAYKFLTTALDNPAKTQVEYFLSWMAGILQGMHKHQPTSSQVLVLGHRAGDDTPWTLTTELLPAILGQHAVKVLHYRAPDTKDFQFVKPGIASDVRRISNLTLGEPDYGKAHVILVGYTPSSYNIVPGTLTPVELGSVSFGYVSCCGAPHLGEQELAYIRSHLLGWEIPPEHTAVLRDLRTTSHDASWDNESLVPAIEHFVRAYAERHPNKIWWQGRMRDMEMHMEILTPELIDARVLANPQKVGMTLTKLKKAGFNVTSFMFTKGAPKVWRIGFDLHKRRNMYFLRIDAVNNVDSQKQWLNAKNAGTIPSAEVFKRDAY